MLYRLLSDQDIIRHVHHYLIQLLQTIIDISLNPIYIEFQFFMCVVIFFTNDRPEFTAIYGNERIDDSNRIFFGIELSHCLCSD